MAIGPTTGRTFARAMEIHRTRKGRLMCPSAEMADSIAANFDLVARHQLGPDGELIFWVEAPRERERA